MTVCVKKVFDFFRSFLPSYPNFVVNSIEISGKCGGNLSLDTRESLLQIERANVYFDNFIVSWIDYTSLSWSWERKNLLLILLTQNIFIYDESSRRKDFP